ncbi:MAG TPA: hypothetical protein VJQ49_04850 [Casimicrobiaceae bacterium]|nr:hypothetical protein [Casimicrobiaceae bacterium]
MRELVADRMKELRQLDFDAVKTLPAHMKMAAPPLGKVKISQHHNVTKTGDHMVVVQAARERWLGIFTAIEVDGFVITSDGTRRALAEREKWDFT